MIESDYIERDDTLVFIGLLLLICTIRSEAPTDADGSDEGFFFGGLSAAKDAILHPFKEANNEDAKGGDGEDRKGD